jgi:hypothetical protein
VKVDFSAPFGPSQHEAWETEYKANIHVEPGSWGLKAHEPFGHPSSLHQCSVPDDWMAELDLMEPAERKLILDELAVRPDLWGDDREVLHD